jgi:F-type H+-transporting ATPase subunit epsilon
LSDPLTVDIVAADRMVWSGEATIVLTRTVAGDIGILANHAPILSVIVPGTVEIRTPEGGYHVFAVDTGFISVAKNHVSILAEYAEPAEEVDVNRAQAELDAARGAGDDGDGDGDRQAVIARADARLRAAEKAR